MDTESFGSPSDPLFDFDLATPDLEHVGVLEGWRLWSTGDGDVVGLLHLPGPPDLPSGDLDAEAFLAAVRAEEEEGGRRWIEGEIREIGLLPAVYTILRGQDDSQGVVFAGTYLFPFAASSYVLQIRCEEHGIMGVREALLLQVGIVSGQIELDESGKIPEDFEPYHPRHDERFPTHPLSRCRRGLRLIESSLVMSDRLLRLPGFRLPAPG